MVVEIECSASSSLKRDRPSYNDYNDDAADLTQERLDTYFLESKPSKPTDIVPIFNIERFHTSKIQYCAEKAIKDYNQKNDTNFEVVEIEHVTVGGSYGFLFHISFNVKPVDMPSDYPTTTFQAKVTYALGDVSVDVCSRSSSLRTYTAASTAHSLLSNIRDLVPVQLASSNYILWKHQVSSILKARGLFGHIDETTPAPEQFIRSASIAPTTEATSDYLQWSYCDQALIKLIKATLSPSAALARVVVASSSARALWLHLIQKYSSITNSQIWTLQNALDNIQKSNAESIEKYTLRIKDRLEELASLSVSVDVAEVVRYTLKGLPVEFDSFRNSIRTRISTISIEKLNVMLKAEENVN